jgi:hypothetical protein
LGLFDIHKCLVCTLQLSLQIGYGFLSVVSFSCHVFSFTRLLLSEVIQLFLEQSLFFVCLTCFCLDLFSLIQSLVCTLQLSLQIGYGFMSVISFSQYRHRFLISLLSEVIQLDLKLLLLLL